MVEDDRHVTDPDDTQRDASHQLLPDYFLRLLVAAANATGFELGVTLHCHGAIISGIIEGGRSHMDALAKLVSEAPGGEAFAQIWEGMSDSYPDPAATTDTDDWDVEGTDYIHLKKVAILANDGMFSLADHRWRGRLSSIDGWTLGMLSPGRP